MSWPQLQAAYAWPEVRPNIKPHLHGWKLHEEVWYDLLRDLRFPILAEIGVWTGKTSRWLLERFPTLRLIAVDLWTPEAVPFTELEYGRMVREKRLRDGDSLADLFRTNVWDHRDRVVAVQSDSVQGIRRIAEFGIAPAVVYIDGNHRYEPVRADIEAALECFPNSVICGDDYFPKSGVGEAVHEIADALGFSVRVLGNKRFWRYG